MNQIPIASPATLSPVAARRRRTHWQNALATWDVSVGGALEYWAHVIRRGAGPMRVSSELAQWLKLMHERQEPTWSTPNSVVFEADVAALRDFSHGSHEEVVPTLLLAPQAGHHSCIIDFTPEQSQVRVMRAAGLRKLYALEWIGATQETKDRGIEDYLDVIDRAVERIGEGPINIVGDCQGGWLATLYGALRPDRVHSLTIAGAPIDFHAGEGPIHEWVDLCSRGGRTMAFYEALVAAGGGVMKGDHMVGGFIGLKPEAEIEKQLQLLRHLDDPHHLRRYRDFEDWFKWTQDIPGTLYLWIVRHLFMENALIRGTLEIAGERVNLRHIKAPLYLLGGKTDHITPPAQVFALADHAGTPPHDVIKRVTSGGHLGLFMGHEALRKHWPPLLAAMSERSHEDAKAARLRQEAEQAVPARAVDPIPVP